jgi:hypothetical protein
MNDLFTAFTQLKFRSGKKATMKRIKWMKIMSQRWNTACLPLAGWALGLID